MSKFIRKTFGGLNAGYYFRHLFFGAILSCLLIYNAYQFYLRDNDLSQFITSIVLSVILALLYPFSRFVYQSIVNFIFGDEVFLVNGIIYLFVKIVMIALCWAFSFIIAPFGLLYLYYYHTKNGTFD